jgi:hypothetical protein
MSINQYLDEDKKIKIWPSKKSVKIEILAYLAEKFDTDVYYTEKEVNEIVKYWHTFGDFFLLRRELIDKKFLSRTQDGAKYWKEERTTPE